MKNADMPAMPLAGDAYTDFADHCYRGGSYNPECQGLTKREMMAMHMMAAIQSKDGASDLKYEAMMAVKAADALLAELDRKTQNQQPATAE